jgi:tetratricopeptide (TPR) repeat protein
MLNMYRGLEPREIEPSHPETPQELDQLLTDLIQSNDKKSTSQIAQTNFDALYEVYTGIKEDVDGNLDMIVETVAILKDRIRNGIAVDDPNKWEWSTFSDATKLISLAELIDDEDETLEIITQLARKIISYLESKLILDPVKDNAFYNEAANILEQFDKRWPSKPECVYCLAELEARMIADDDMDSRILSRRPETTEDETMSEREEIRARFQEVLNDVAQIDTANYETWVKVAVPYARFLLKSEELDQFTYLYAEICKRNSDNPAVVSLRGEYLLDHAPEDIQRFLPVLEQAQSENPENLEVLFVLGRIYNFQNDLENLSRVIQRIRILDPEDKHHNMELLFTPSSH